VWWAIFKMRQAASNGGSRASVVKEDHQANIGVNYW